MFENFFLKSFTPFNHFVLLTSFHILIGPYREGKIKKTAVPTKRNDGFEYNKSNYRPILIKPVKPILSQIARTQKYR